MKLVLGLLLITPIVSFAKDREVTELRGTVNYEKPCTLADNPKGCLRIIADGGFYYLQREDHTPNAEFNIVDNKSDSDPKLFQVWPSDLNMVLLTEGQPVLIKGKIRAYGNSGSNGGKILKADKILMTGHLDNPEITKKAKDASAGTEEAQAH